MENETKGKTEVNDVKEIKDVKDYKDAKIKIDIDRYRVKEGDTINLKKFATYCDQDVDKSAVKNYAFPQALDEISLLQAKLFAQSTYGLIIVLQAMDAAGKDSTIKHVFSHLDPNGVHVVSFKQPTEEEKDHDYMWRINKALPRRGDIGVFNRSHYEDVIVSRVHNLIEQGKMPKNLISKDIWDIRYRQIRDWETYLNENGFPIVKIFLHLLAQCSRVGGNLNQLARHFNSGGADTEQIRAKLLDELADLTAFRLHAEKVLGELYGNAQAYKL